MVPAPKNVNIFRRQKKMVAGSLILNVVFHERKPRFLVG